MTNESTPAVRVSSPGRVCLFGEHQDYLQLAVVAAAISLRIRLQGRRRTDRWVEIDLPDIGGRERFLLNGELVYERERDYFRSAVNVLRRAGFRFSRGFDCRVNGEIPINAGTSSSSALVVAWIDFLARVSDPGAALDAESVARYAHQAEVLEFGEPGGMMDHFTTAVGGVVAIDFFPDVRLTRLPADLGTFVLGNSLEPKDTKGILARVKGGILHTAEKLKTRHKEFSLQRVRAAELPSLAGELTSEELQLLSGTVRNRDITVEARRLLAAPSPDRQRLGALLNEHQAVLRDVLHISTPKIDAMIATALEAGALGAKINGSGGGGCMFAYAPENPQQVLQAMERFGPAWVVRVDRGIAPG